MSKYPHPADIYAGNKLHFQRQVRRLSQGALADALGVTFQQVQKYEKGMNRMSASRLQTIARILDVPVSFFFDDDEAPVGGDAASRYRADNDQTAGFLSSREVVQLSRDFAAIKNPGYRRAVLAFVIALSEARE